MYTTIYSESTRVRYIGRACSQWSALFGLAMFYKSTCVYYDEEGWRHVFDTCLVVEFVSYAVDNVPGLAVRKNMLAKNAWTFSLTHTGGIRKSLSAIGKVRPEPFL